MDVISPESLGEVKKSEPAKTQQHNPDLVPGGTWDQDSDGVA
jgi:hypothetical protein